MITNYLDRDVGRIMDTLEQLGLRDDTLMMFASDNGAHNEGGHNVNFFHSSGESPSSLCTASTLICHKYRTCAVDCPGPLRGFKRSLYEG